MIYLGVGDYRKTCEKIEKNKYPGFVMKWSNVHSHVGTLENRWCIHMHSRSIAEVEYSREEINKYRFLQ